MAKRKFSLLWLVLAVALPGALAALPLVTQDASSQGLVELEGLDGTTRAVPLEGFSLAGLDEQSARVRFRTEREPEPGKGGFVLQLLNGDRVRGDALAGGEESLRIEIVGGTKLDFRIDSFRALFSGELLGREAELPAPESGDRLWRKVGSGFDRIDGFLVGFSASGLSFEGQLGEREYPWAEVAALWVESLGAPPSQAAPEGARVAVDLADGSRLRALFAGISDGQVGLKTADGADVMLPIDAVLELNLDDRRLSFVSALPFESLTSGGLFGDEFGMQYPPRRDLSVLGGPLVVRGQHYAHGLGVHSPSRLALDWSQGGYLRGFVALDDSAQRTATGGSVIFRIRLDGKLAFESSELSSKAAPVELPGLELAGKRRIELEVDPASDSVIGDRADWLDLRITAE